MRLIQFQLNGKRQFGAELKDGKRIYNLSHIADNCIDYLRLTDANRSLEDDVRHEVAQAEDAKDGSTRIVLKSNIDKLLAPITAPDKLICMGMNYKDHCEEQNKPVPVEPYFFNKWPSCIVGPTDPILYPKYDDISQQLDWEVELAFVIGKKGKYIPRSEALDYVAGYTVAMDGSARDLQFYKNEGQWILGKTLDTFCPLGPALVTRDEVPDVHSLNLSCLVNDVVKQDSNTSKLVFKIDVIVAHLSRYFTLLPGDIVVTGTPPGVGCFKKPPEYLKVGDVVECRIEKLGVIRNPVVREE